LRAVLIVGQVPNAFSTGAHILNDWALFSLQLLGAGLVAAS
jgi:hypothetical protein